MKQSGRVNWLIIAVVAAAIFFGFVFAMGKESVSSVGARFMTALAKGDVDGLTNLTDLGDRPKDAVHSAWEFAIKTAGQHYRFTWRIVASEVATDGKTGAVHLQVARNADQPGAYEESFQLPMVNDNGQWKVDVAGISREMFPGLPR